MKTYLRPLKRGASWRSQNFGDNLTIYGPHTGNDEAADIGTPVYAAGDGVIDWAGQFDDTYADNLLWLLNMGGNTAVLNCGAEEPSFVYAHLSRFLVKRGDTVRKGQIIAYTGNTGTATTGAHLHVEAIPPGYSLNSPMLGRVNPDIYLTEWPDDYLGAAGLAAQAGTITPLPEEEQLVPNAKDRVFTSKDGSKVSLEEILNSMDNKIDGIPAFLESFSSLNADLRGEADIARAQTRTTAAALATVIEMLAKQQSLDAAQIKQAVADAIADGITLTVQAGK